MIDRIFQAIQDASNLVKDQANNLGEGAKEKVYQLIDEWLNNFPRLNALGLKTQTFALTLGFNPALEAELNGQHSDFTPEKLQNILAEVRDNPVLNTVFSSIKTTYTLHRKIEAPLSGQLVVRLRIKITPDVKVIIGSGWTPND